MYHFHFSFINVCGTQVGLVRLNSGNVCGPLAQLAEQLTLNQQVQGSIPWWLIFEAKSSPDTTKTGLFPNLLTQWVLACLASIENS
jgi:hypothetical protein